MGHDDRRTRRILIEVLFRGANERSDCLPSSQGRPRPPWFAPTFFNVLVVSTVLVAEG